MKPKFYNGNALIIGGNRFVGKALASEIVWAHRFNNVDVFNRSGTGPWGTTVIQGDRNKREDLEKINFKKYDFIVDMCLYNPEQYEKCAKLRDILIGSGEPLEVKSETTASRTTA